VVQPHVGATVLIATGHTSHTDSSGQFQRLCHVCSYRPTPVVPACCIHSLSVQLCVPCPCTFCISHRHLSIFTLMALVLNAWSCAGIRNRSVSFFILPDASHTQLFESANSHLCLRPTQPFIPSTSINEK